MGAEDDDVIVAKVGKPGESEQFFDRLFEGVPSMHADEIQRESKIA